MEIGKLIEGLSRGHPFEGDVRVKVGNKFHKIKCIGERIGYPGYNGVYIELLED